MTMSNEVKELAKKLETGKSAEAKKIEALLKATDSDAVKQALSERLRELEQPSVEFDQVVFEAESLGYSKEYVFRLGLSKLANQLAWQEKQAEKKAE